MTTRAGTHYSKSYTPKSGILSSKETSQKKRAKRRKKLLVAEMATPMKIEKFDGSSDSTPIKDWLLVADVALEKVKDDKDKIRSLVQHLRGPALTFYAKRILPNAASLTFAEATDELVARFDVEPA